MCAPGSTDHSTIEHRLATADLTVLGRMPWSSNVTLLVEVAGNGDDIAPARAVYKPHRGEQPLWDFPDGLYRREVAAYELSRTLGWDLVPPTVGATAPSGWDRSSGSWKPISPSTTSRCWRTPTCSTNSAGCVYST